jgi:hypothetical protein
MANRYLLDTDIIIEYLRGKELATDFVESLEGELLLSVITVAELFSGIRDQTEERSLEQFLLAFQVVSVNDFIAKQGGALRRAYRQSHGTGLADALIAATAIGSEATLVTFNKRHFPMLDEVQVPYERN